MEKVKVLGTRLDLIGRVETMALLRSWLKLRDRGPLKQIVTAYSEFFVTALADIEFRRVIDEADLVVPDGVGPLAAVSYQSRLAGSSSTRSPVLRKLWLGMTTGVDILRHKVGETVPGVWLFEELVAEAARSGKKVFLLGGFSDVAKSLAEKLKSRYPELVVGYDPGVVAGSVMEMTGTANDEVVRKINNFGPDILFVAYGPVKQEKWIAMNKINLRARIAVGVGGTFDELTGRVKPAPTWLSGMGLKWLSRLTQQPRRLGRIWQGVVVFPWLVFRKS